ncbi:TIGR01777 family protein [bacterium]|nr:TIGR01777 family protein [bacterium]
MTSLPRKVIMAGASGLLGSSLASQLESEGHTVLRLARYGSDHRAGTVRDLIIPPALRGGQRGGVMPLSASCALPFRNQVYWNPATGEMDSASLEATDAVVNLAGRNLTAGRWSEAVKRDLYDSRIRSTELLARTLASLKQPPKVLISASAVGYYPSSRTDVFDENSAPGTEFLSTLCRDWEQATRPASEAGIRVVNLRIGVVLTRLGGMLAKVLPIFRLGFGGPIGDGGQWLSWIALPDLLSLIRHALTDERYCGPINAVTETPVTNREFTKSLAQALHRPAFLPVPAFGISLLFGEMGRQTVLASQNVTPKRLKDLNFHWQHSDLTEFLHAELA